MKLKYVGPKPTISEHGINFKNGKEDKYVYINIAIQIINAINHNYEKGRIYKQHLEDTKYEDFEIENIIFKYKPELKETIKSQVQSYKLHLKNEIKNIKVSHPLLNEVELDALENNLNIMKEYRVQRAINKIYYIHIVEVIKDIIKKHKIKDISVPFNERFWHVMQTVQGELAKGKDYRKSDLNEHENQTIELVIHNF